MTKLENTTFLVQRLLPPPKSERMALAEQVFGGGMIQLSPDGWKAVQKHFSIDYMGSAEFEFGTIPLCLKALMLDNEKLSAFSFVVPAKAIKPNEWTRGRAARTKAGKVAKKQPKHPPVVDREVYVLCREEFTESVKGRILELAGDKLRLKEGSNFPRALDPVGEDRFPVGWLELDNGFFFFIDQTMWRGVTGLFTGKDPVDQTGVEG